MRFPVKPKKKLSQNFMTGEQELAAIAEALSIKTGETVIEIGPGPGALTRALLKKGARVIAIEKDPKLVGHLNEQFEGKSLEVHCRDILHTDLAAFSLGGRVKVAGNIPYHITSPIIEWLIAHRALISETVLTVQWEVARRLSALPGGKDWGSLSVFLQLYADVELLRKIDKSRFFPAPKVDSGVVRLRFLPGARFAVDEVLFFKLVRKAFQKRRKTLLNGLVDKEGDARYSKEALLEAFEGCGIDPQRRPETLALKEWAALSDTLGSLE